MNDPVLKGVSTEELPFVVTDSKFRSYGEACGQQIKNLDRGYQDVGPALQSAFSHLVLKGEQNNTNYIPDINTELWLTANPDGFQTLLEKQSSWDPHSSLRSQYTLPSTITIPFENTH